MRYVCSKDVKKMLLRLLEEVGSKALVRRIEGGYLTGTGSGCAAEEDQGRMDCKTLKCCEEIIWKEAGCGNECSTLVGRMNVSARPVTMRKAPKSTGSTIVQNGTKSDGEFQMPSESGCNK